MTRNRCISKLKSVLAATILTVITTSALAEINGHRPDGWQVTGTKTNDVFNAHMGPGTAYPVIKAFAHNERDMQQQSKHEPYTDSADIDPIAQAQDLVREIYERQFQSENSQLPSAFDPEVAKNYFTDDIVALLASGKIGAHPLYGVQDFDGTIEDPMPDPHQPMLRGMITIHVDFTNFSKKQRVVFYLRADTKKPGAPLRIFRVEHEGWSYP